MPDYRYNPIENNFTTYEAVETPKVELNLPLMNSPLDISDWSTGISENGTPIVKSNLPKMTDNGTIAEFNPSVEESTSYVTSANNSGNKKKAMEFFQNKGLKPHQAAGIVGNLLGESNLNHTAVNKSSGAYGLAQWLGSRKTALLSKYGKNPTFDQQLEFLWDELQGSENASLKALMATSTYEAATDSFMRNFERPSKKEMADSINRRIKYAKSLLA